MSSESQVIELPTASIAARLERLPVCSVHYRLLIACGMGWLFDAMDVGIVTFALAPIAKEWKLSPAQVGLVGSSGLAGMFVGGGGSRDAGGSPRAQVCFSIYTLVVCRRHLIVRRCTKLSSDARVQVSRRDRTGW